MDELVKAAMAKWPTVPDCFGWLALDARGDWFMRDERCQAAGPFPVAKGSRIEHAQLRAFIERNYAADAQGRWYFQNGPQRVFVELEAAPWVWRLQPQADGAPRLLDPCGAVVEPWSANGPLLWLDEGERLFIATRRGLGLVHTLDMEAAADAIEQGRWAPPQASDLNTLARHFGHCLSPQSQAMPASS